MATAVMQNPTVQNVLALLPKVTDPDADYRYMALNDLNTMLLTGHQGFLQHDYHACCRVVDALVLALQDSNGEVQNMAIKCIGPLILKAPAEIYPPMVDKLSMLQVGNAVDNSIPALALRATVVAFPRPAPGLTPSKAVSDAYSAISRVLIVRLVGYTVIPHGIPNTTKVPKGMIKADIENGTDSNSVDVLTEVARCFGPILQEVEVRALQKALTELLESDRVGSVLKKKAITALSILAGYFSDSHLSSFVSNIVESLRSSHLTSAKQRMYITMFGSMARSIPRKFGPHLKTLAPFILSPVSQNKLNQDRERGAEEERDPGIDEVREAALVALESFLVSCTDDMRPYMKDSVEAALRFLKYNPNMADDDDDDMGGTQGDDDYEEDKISDAEDANEDFEEDDAFDDEDDTSWKVRRCAVKVLYALVLNQDSQKLLSYGNDLFETLAQALISRFGEPEESVRVEVLVTLALLIRTARLRGAAAESSSDGETLEGVLPTSRNRKRRRGGSDKSMFDSQAKVFTSSMHTPSNATVDIPPSASQSLADLGEQIVRESAKVLRSSSAATKQASISLLKDFMMTMQGGLPDLTGQLIDPLVNALSASSTQTATRAVSFAVGSASSTSLRIEALQLVGMITATHNSDVLRPHLPKIIPAVTSAVKDRYSKISSEAVLTAESLIKSLTPPQAVASVPETSNHLRELYKAITNRIYANDADIEVRQRAIQTLGTLLGHTSGAAGAALLHPSVRAEALGMLLDRLKNELTRMASITAIHTVGSLAKDKKEFSATWMRAVCLELCGQFRKVSRALRVASLETLKTLIVNPAGRQSLDADCIREITAKTQPLLLTNDLQFLGSAFVILAVLVQDHGRDVVNDELNKAVCFVVATSISGAALEALLFLVQSIGDKGLGSSLMQALLKDVGIGGNVDVLGKVIGTLLVHGKSTVPVELNDFMSELRTATDDKRKCLALAVLGEAGLRLNTSSPLGAEVFLAYFTSKSQPVAMAAAVALGRAGAGNIPKYLPAVLSSMSKPSSPQILLLHSIREMLAHSQAEEEIAMHASRLWKNVMAASEIEDNRVIAAECLGRLVTIDPKTYLPTLQALISDERPQRRHMAILSIRYSFVDSDYTYDDWLKPVLPRLLKDMLSDPALENRRQALATFNSAMHSKPNLALPTLSDLLPLIMRETMVKPELVREVQMGPFKHKVDDGLEVRKSAYETLYALMDSAFSRVNVSDFYGRVIAGIGDDHDIRILCLLMLSKLISLAPDETVLRLDPLADQLKNVLSYKPKENTVKQELEKANEAIKGVLRVSTQLNKTLAADTGANDAAVGNHVWRSYWEWVKKDFATQLKKVEEESKERNG